MKNILIQRDLRNLNRNWFRRPLIVGLIVAAIPFWLACIYLGALEDHGPEWLLWYGFAAFHLFVHVFIPFRSIRVARNARTDGLIDLCRITPIQHKDLFWCLWLRGFGYLAFLLMFYLPLFFLFAWLYALGEPGEAEWGVARLDQTRLEAISWRFPVLSELIIDQFIFLVLLIPWVKSKTARAFLIAGAFVGMVGVPILDSTMLDLRILKAFSSDGAQPQFYWGSYAHAHPAVTLLYFISTAAYGAAIGVWAGIRYYADAAKAIILVALLGPILEFATQTIFSGSWDVHSFGGLISWMMLYIMLMFYISSVGAFWMGMKWIVLIFISRLKLPPE